MKMIISIIVHTNSNIKIMTVIYGNIIIGESIESSRIEINTIKSFSFKLFQVTQKNKREREREREIDRYVYI